MLLDSCIQPSDYVGGTLDIALTIMRAQTQVPHGTGLELELTQGKTYTAQSRIDVIRPLKLHVNGSADRDVSGAAIQWTAGYTGVGMELHYPGTYKPDLAAGSLLTMRGINIQGPGYLTGNSSSHGILAHTRFVIEHCRIQDWCGDGLHIDNPTLPNGNHSVADFLQLHACWFQNIGQTGVYIHGPDTQVGIFSRCGAINCGLVGGSAAALFWDDSFFGNLWLSCDANNILYSGGVPISATRCPTTFRATNGNARATFLNCYTEGGAPSRAAQVNAPSMIIGGMAMFIEPGYTGLNLLPQVNGYLTISPGLHQFNALSSGDVVGFRATDAAIANVAYGFESSDEGPEAWRWMHSSPLKTFGRFWNMIYGNSEGQISMSMADQRCTSMTPGAVWFQKARTYFGSTGPGGLGNSIEWGGGAPGATTGHLKGDVYFDRSGHIYMFNGTTWGLLV